MQWRLTMSKTTKADWTFGIQRHEQETDYDDYVTYHVYLVSYHRGTYSDTYSLVACATYVSSNEDARAKAEEFAAMFRAKGSTAEVIDLPTIRRCHPELASNFLG